MAGGVGAVDPERCKQYAAFASHLDRKSFDFIYWFLFVLVICMLFLASWKYSGLVALTKVLPSTHRGTDMARSSDLEKVRLQGLEPGSPGYRFRMKRCMMVCSIYAAISIVAVVMEIYALMAMQFCDGEALMSLYWSTFTTMQFGSVIAILGILLSMLNNLRGNKNP